MKGFQNTGTHPSSSRELLKEPVRKEVPGNTEFVVTSRKIGIARYARGDLITANHMVLEEGATRNNHRNAVVVQEMATQWIQSHPCKTKTSKETEKKACRSSWSRHGNKKSFTLITL